jgi:hypothetical protein
MTTPVHSPWTRYRPVWLETRPEVPPDRAYAASPQTAWRLPQQGNRIAGLRMQHLVRFLLAPWLKDFERNVPKD